MVEQCDLDRLPVEAVADAKWRGVRAIWQHD